MHTDRCSGVSVQWGSMSRRLSVQGVSVQEGLCPGGLCLEGRPLAREQND